VLHLDVDCPLLAILGHLDFVELEGSNNCWWARFLLHHQIFIYTFYERILDKNVRKIASKITTPKMHFCGSSVNG